MLLVRPNIIWRGGLRRQKNAAVLILKTDKQGIFAGSFHPWDKNSSPFYLPAWYNKPLPYLTPTKHPSCSSIILNYLELSKIAKPLCPCHFLHPGCPTGDFLLTLEGWNVISGNFSQSYLRLVFLLCIPEHVVHILFRYRVYLTPIIISLYAYTIQTHV